MGDFPSGQRGQTVNLLSLTSVVRIHLPPPKNPSRKTWIFSFVPQGTTSFACNARNIISSEARTSLPPRAVQMNDVAPLVKMKLPSANDVMLRINDVALRANGYAFGVIWRKTVEKFIRL